MIDGVQRKILQENIQLDLHSADPRELYDVLKKAWNKFVLAKVARFVWKLMQQRVPTKDNLAKWGILYNENRFCPIYRQNRRM